MKRKGTIKDLKKHLDGFHENDTVWEDENGRTIIRSENKECSSYHETMNLLEMM